MVLLYLISKTRDAKHNKKDPYRYVSQKRKIKESVPICANENTGKLIATGYNNFNLK